MSILIDEKTRVVVQGITGNEGLFHTRQMVEYGTKVVAGVTPGKGGQKIDDIPVFNTVAEAVKASAGVRVRTPGCWLVTCMVVADALQLLVSLASLTAFVSSAQAMR